MDEKREGKVAFSAPPETCLSTHYKIVGDIRSGSPPLIVLHGGPGFGHEYMLPHQDLWTLYGIPVIFYDQVGCGMSTRLPHTIGDTSFWNIELFIKELENLLGHLELDHANGPGYDILGHSWGGTLGADFASRRPPGLRRLILTGTVADGEICQAGYWEFSKRLSAQTQKALREAVDNDDFTSAEYQAASAEFYNTALCRAEPFPEVLTRGMAEMAADPTVYATFQGKSLFARDGQMIHISSIPYLHRIEAPTLVMNGELDAIEYEGAAPFFELIPKVRWVTLTGGTHMPFLDSPELLEKSLKIIGGFLRPGKSTLPRN